MNIVVCIKQVPGTTKVAIDEETGSLMRSGTESKLNPYDLYALETALRIKEKIGGSITVITMGPPQAAAIIREAYAMGADSGVLLSDKAFAGADVLATSHALAGGIQKIGEYDLIICGKQTTDGDTAQVGPELADLLDIPHMTNITDIANITDNEIRVFADLGEYIETFDITLPCLITVDKGALVPRLPSYRRMLASAGREVLILGIDDLPDQDPDKYGLNGSPTRVEKVYPPDIKTEKHIIDGSSKTVAEKLFNELRALKFV